jgi:hypothetical protein
MRQAHLTHLPAIESSGWWHVVGECWLSSATVPALSGLPEMIIQQPWIDADNGHHRPDLVGPPRPRNIRLSTKTDGMVNGHSSASQS